MSDEQARGDSPKRFNFNTVVALGSILLGAAIFVLTPYQVAEPPALFGRSTSGISPQLFPRIAGIGFIVFGAALALVSLRLRETNTFAELPWGSYVNVAVIVAIMLGYVALLRPAGFVASSALAATAISVFYGSRNVFGIAFVGFVAPLTIYLLFTRALGVSLPAFPWG